MRYRYKALTLAGVACSGQQEATSVGALQQQLLSAQLVLLQARPAPVRSPRRLSTEAHAQWCFQLHQLLAAGVPMHEALAELSASTADARVAEQIRQLHTRLQHGASLTTAMQAAAACFDPLLLQGVAAGEASGQLVAVLARLQLHFAWRAQMQRQTRKALGYPLFAAVVLLAAISFLLVYLLPQVRDFVASTGAPLPLATRALLALAAGLQRFGVALLSIACMGALALALAWRTSVAFRQTLAHWSLRMPVAGRLLCEGLWSHYARSLALLYEAGVPVLHALALAEDGVRNRHLRIALHAARGQIEQGQTLATALGRIQPAPTLLPGLLRTGENSGQLGAALNQLANSCEHAVRQHTERMQALIEPLLTLVLGAMLAWVMLAVLGPVFDSLGALR
ncbi:type II secretion system F family protein [Amantichitinum ursilacus]|uniref:Putative type II secretion system protein F n=1 Tax=Amantichitinum ursilacus TaxID=857265 RepID=A0A0N1JTA2_9NEIS|nr:type II secretion system F family protein [Amantichitinum ursilacus]KPC54008.1 putative type II secretion system protein F [Amantichitinum ursilacus]